MEDSIICLESLTSEANRSWADFPQELLSLILSRLYFRDRCNFKLVCKSWNLVCPVPPSLPPAKNSAEFDSPCLIISQRSSRSWKLFHSLCNDFYYMDFPELVDAEILYSNYGWLLMSKYKLMIFFFNPFTKEKIELPPVPGPFSSSVCFTSPPTSSDCTVFGISSHCMFHWIDIFVIKVGDVAWDIKFLDNDEFFWTSNCPPIFLNGVCYCFDYRFRNIITYDLLENKYEIIQYEKCRDEEEEEDGNDDGPPASRRSFLTNLDRERPPVTRDGYMIEVDGDIWGVFVTRNNSRVSVQKLDFSKKCWTKIKSLGNKCLYVSTDGSFAKTCSTGGMANKIYFNKFHDKSRVMYSLTSRMYHSVGKRFVSKDAYGLSEVDYSVWVKPALLME